VVEATHGILKKNQVRSAGVCPLDAAATPPPAAAVKSDARLVEQHPDHAVLEVRCACGRITHVHCRWPIPGAAPAATNPNQTLA
jgi:hypothetical protein